jgi:hypothetical protein
MSDQQFTISNTELNNFDLQRRAASSPEAPDRSGVQSDQQLNQPKLCFNDVNNSNEIEDNSPPVSNDYNECFDDYSNIHPNVHAKFSRISRSLVDVSTVLEYFEKVRNDHQLDRALSEEENDGDDYDWSKVDQTIE